MTASSIHFHLNVFYGTVCKMYAYENVCLQNSLKKEYGMLTKEPNEPSLTYKHENNVESCKIITLKNYKMS